ncbi:MAG TPA: MarR family transcriptional regulator [Solirubrobacterales bacterium]|nr:MarR family transcriptional regulator [Solirubrobacterales bacterium]
MSTEAVTATTPAAGASAAASRCREKTPHGEAWGALTRTHAAVTTRLQDALAQADFPPLPWYEMLATVADAPDQRMRMGDLAESLVITRGGLTKLLDRLIKAGLMERTFCETDRRVSYATLLPAGAELLEEMRPVVVGELEVAFSANLTTRQAEQLREMLDRVRGTACGTE